jgi:uncharacterized membrane protein
METRRFRTLNQWIVLGLAVGYLTLVFDLRYDHNHALKHNAIAWTPIIYSAVMTVVSLIALALWERNGRRLLFWLSATGIVVSLLGFWLHNSGHIATQVGTMLSVWAGQHPDPVTQPPVMAPLAFAGLALLGMAAAHPISRRATYSDGY